MSGYSWGRGLIIIDPHFQTPPPQMANHTPLFAYHPTTLFQPPPTLIHPRLHNFIRNHIYNSTSTTSTSSPVEKKVRVVYLSKRLLLNLSISTLLISSSPSNVIAAEQDPELVRYTDSLQGFTLLRPSSYIEVGTYPPSSCICIRVHVKRLLQHPIMWLFIVAIRKVEFSV